MGEMGEMGKRRENGGKWGEMRENEGKWGGMRENGGEWGEMRGKWQKMGNGEKLPMIHSKKCRKNG